jgi:hypothetical protein
MRFYTKQHQFYCGIDLHADAIYICILNSVGDIVVHNNILTKPKSFLRLIKPYRDGLVITKLFSAAFFDWRSVLLPQTFARWSNTTRAG